MTDKLTTIGTGVSGLDELLRGGFVRGRMYLISGPSGTGKTLLGMHFLAEGLEAGETTLSIHGEESRSEMLANGRALGIDLDRVEFLDLGPESDVFTGEESADLVDPSELERDRHVKAIHNAVAEIDPDRVVVDPITQLQYLEPTEYQYRKRVLSFIRFLKERNATVLTTATGTGGENRELRSVSDGIVELSRGDEGRRIRVAKHRGRGQRDGDHGMAIRPDGIEVFPSLVPDPTERSFDPEQLETGVAELDELVGGGIERETVTFISGPTGVGKTTIATQFATHAAREDGNAAIYLFEENAETFIHRSESLKIPVGQLCDADRLSVNEIEPLSLSAEEFAMDVMADVKRRGVDVVLIDGVDGYTMSIQGQKGDLVRELHALTRILKNAGVTVFVTDEISTVTGLSAATSSNISYLADNILSLNYIEIDGELRRIVGVLKKRAGGFDPTLREFELTEEGILIGATPTGIDGILQGRPSVGE